MRVIAFDLDDTLWETRPILDAAEQALFDWCCKRHARFEKLYTRGSFDALRVTHKQPGPMATQIYATRLKALNTAFLNCGATTQSAKQLAQEALEYFLVERQKVRPFKNAKTLLKILSKNYRLVAATNGNADVFQTTLGEYMEAQFHAEVIGYAKPDPRFFTHLENALGVDKNACVLIGDSDKYDRAGANAANWHFISLAPTNTDRTINVAAVVDQIGRLP